MENKCKYYGNGIVTRRKSDVSGYVELADRASKNVSKTIECTRRSSYIATSVIYSILFFPLGLIALFYSVKTIAAIRVNDVVKTISYSKKAAAATQIFTTALIALAIYGLYLALEILPKISIMANA